MTLVYDFYWIHIFFSQNMILQSQHESFLLKTQTTSWIVSCFSCKYLSHYFWKHYMMVRKRVWEYIFLILQNIFHSFLFKFVCWNMFSDQWSISYPIYYFGWYIQLVKHAKPRAMQRIEYWHCCLLHFPTLQFPWFPFVIDLSLYISSKLFMHAF